MKLKKTNVEWALKHVLKLGDTDLCPRPFELDIVQDNAAAIASELGDIDITNHVWSGARRLMVPKTEFSFRPVCQLDPLDSIMFAAIVREIGTRIGSRRPAIVDQKVFSYRFAPKKSGKLYNENVGWEQFWKHSSDEAKKHKYVLVTDLSDFYNQIYHHTIENQLNECGIAKSYWTALKRLISNVSEGVSRGVPIGPHPSHLLAELSMIPVDEFISSLDVKHCRYVDDIHIFCESRERAQAILFQLVDFLDKTQKMQINKQKTVIHSGAAFRKIANENLVDKPINNLERQVILVVKENTNSPYERVQISKVSAEDVSKLSQANIESVLSEYIDAPEVDFVRLRWFIRRLAQVGAPGGIPFIVGRFSDFLPAISEVALYFEAAADNYKGNWKAIGGQLIDLYFTGLVQASEYLQVVILSLFGRVRALNHVNKLTSMYPKASPACRRKIVLAARAAGAASWLSSLKSDYKNADPWLQRALIISMEALPTDERDFWLKGVKLRVKSLAALTAERVLPMKKKKAKKKGAASGKGRKKLAP